MRNPFNFKNWATPVKSKPWAVAAVLAEQVKRASGYRILVGPAHRYWERAVGVR